MRSPPSGSRHPLQTTLEDMIACVDVHYTETSAIAACVVFEGWTNEEWVEERTVEGRVAAPYESGKLYKRELPPILSVLGTMENEIDCVIIDGNVWLDDEGTAGLGAKLHEALDRAIPVIGVAKNRYFEGERLIAITRGGSERPLFVTSVGIGLGRAARHVRRMRGPHRIPMTLKRADALARGHVRPGETDQDTES